MTAAPLPSSTLDAAPAAAKDAAPLRTLALAGSAWTMGEYLFCNVLRLVTNMVMAHLLFPEAFGVMTIAGALVQALEMFADVGVGLSIVQHPRGEDPAFLNTAWTIQVIRGLVLCLVACALAIPYALLYGQPVLAWVVPACGLIFVINGLQSTNMATCGRSLNLRRLVALGVAEAIVKSSVMILWAFISPSVWALVAGSLITYALSAVASHVMLPGIRNRFAWDKDAASQMIRFGKWVFLSTALTYLAVSSDRLVVAKLVPLAVVGVYGTACVFSKIPFDICSRLAAQVQFPALTAVFRRDPARLSDRLLESRAMILSVAQFGVAGVVVVSPAFFALCYDDRYAQAAVFAPMMAWATWISILQASADRALLASGDTRSLALSNAANFAVTIAASVGGFLAAGMTGFIVGVGVGNLAGHAVVHVALRRVGVRLLRQDLAFTGSLALATAVGAALPSILRDDERMVAVNVLLATLAMLTSAATLCRGLERVVEPAMRRVARALAGRSPAGGDAT
ncbi:MAG: oligosaccharide flippase family protein [Phycisphaerae bacterium]|jgi:O-antigen/teichoic acid export membrane protein